MLDVCTSTVEEIEFKWDGSHAGLCILSLKNLVWKLLYCTLCKIIQATLHMSYLIGQFFPLFHHISNLHLSKELSDLKIVVIHVICEFSSS